MHFECVYVQETSLKIVLEITWPEMCKFTWNIADKVQIQNENN
jgi:hypothetical protein